MEKRKKSIFLINGSTNKNIWEPIKVIAESKED